MTDVRAEVANATAKESRGEPRGDFIWYELMTPDPEGAKAFYDAVVGWNIGPAVAEYNGYRMIGRSDGKFAGGVLQLNDEMQQHGARPTWLGYILVPDVDKDAFRRVVHNRPEIAEVVSLVMAQRRVELTAVREEMDAETRSKRVAVERKRILSGIQSFFGLDEGG